MGTHRLLSSSFLGLPYRILKMNHKKELLRSLWVVQGFYIISRILGFSGLGTPKGSSKGSFKGSPENPILLK